jgi:RNase P subunit RPR2
MPRKTITHMRHPDSKSIYVLACGNRISPYGTSITPDWKKVTCKRCKQVQFKRSITEDIERPEGLLS